METITQNRKTKRRAVIIGGAGFIGSNLAHHLLTSTDADVHVFDNLSRLGVQHNLRWLRSADRQDRLKITTADVRQFSQLTAAVEDATEVYHFAAQVAVTTSLLDPRHDFEVNLTGTFNVLEAVRAAGRNPFVFFTSTNKVYGDFKASGLKMTEKRYVYTDRCGISEAQTLDFHSPYGCSKGAADQYVHDYSRIYKIPSVVFRMSCIAGERQFGNEDQGWVAHFLYSALHGNPVVIYGDGRQVRDVLYVGDLIQAIETARECLDRTAGQIYNIGGGPENTISLLELIDEIRFLTGERLRYVHDQRRPGDQLIYITDFTKFTRHTGWKPRTNVRQTVEHIYRWWKSNRELFVPDEAPVTASPVVPSSLAELPRTA